MGEADDGDDDEYGTQNEAYDGSCGETEHDDDVIKWKHFPRYWAFVRGIHRSPVNSLTKASDAELWCFLWSAPEQTVK